MIAPITPLFPSYAIPGMGEAGKVAAIVIGLAAILIDVGWNIKIHKKGMT